MKLTNIYIINYRVRVYGSDVGLSYGENVKTEYVQGLSRVVIKLQKNYHPTSRIPGTWYAKSNETEPNNIKWVEVSRLKLS
jgi:LEA14-like dessication related protein